MSGQTDVVDTDDKLYVMSGDQLRTLARLVHLQEAQNVRKMEFRSAFHRNRYLQDTRKVYQSAVGLLDSMDENKIKYQDHEASRNVYKNLHQFVSLTVGIAFKNAWNLHFRDRYLESIRSFAKEKLVSFNEILSNTELDPAEKFLQLDKIVREVADHKKVALDILKSRENPTARNFSEFFMKITRRPEDTFERLVRKYRKKLIEKRKRKTSDLETNEDGTQPLEETKPVDITGEETEPTEVPGEETEPVEVPGEENRPTDVTGDTEGRSIGPTEEIRPTEAEVLQPKKLLVPDTAEVYNEILASSGKPTYPKLVAIAKGASRALIVLQLGLIVYHTCTSSEPWWQTAVKDTSTLAVSLGAGLAGEFIGTAAATAALGVLGFSATTLAGSGFVLAASVATGFGLAVAAGYLVGLLFDEIFKSGGEAPKKKYVPPHPSTEHLMIHFIPVVDGQRLARQLTAASTPKP